VSLEPVGFVELPGGTNSGFDHADTLLRPEPSRMYVAHTATNAVDVIECRTNTYLRSLGDLPGVAGLLIDSDRDLLFTSDRAAARVSVFRASDESLLTQVTVGPRPNGLAFDTRRRHLYAFNLGEPAGTACTASVVAIDKGSVVRTILLPGRPRWAIYAPAMDLVFVNIQDPAIIMMIDGETMAEKGRIEVGAAGPHGLGLSDGRLFCAADGAALAIVDELTDRPRVAKQLPLRGAPDVVMVDDRRHRLFIAIGSPGVVTLFDTDRLEEIETIETEEGAHTIGWDAVTAQLYAFAPKRGGALVYRLAR
jgi:hypothetical protein